MSSMSIVAPPLRMKKRNPRRTIGWLLSKVDARWLVGFGFLTTALATFHMTGLSLDIDFRQSNHEGELIDWIQEAGASKSGGIVLNAGGYTHTSIAIRDAVAAVAVPVIEVHISNIYARDEFRHHSHIAPVAKATLAGFGVAGYELAIAGLAALLGQNQLASRAAGKRKS